MALKGEDCRGRFGKGNQQWEKGLGCLSTHPAVVSCYWGWVQRTGRGLQENCGQGWWMHNQSLPFAGETALEEEMKVC